MRDNRISKDTINLSRPFEHAHLFSLRKYKRNLHQLTSDAEKVANFL